MRKEYPPGGIAIDKAFMTIAVTVSPVTPAFCQSVVLAMQNSNMRS